MTHVDGRTSGPAPPGFSLISAAPVVMFLAANRVAGLRWAVIASTLASLALVFNRRRKGVPLGTFMPLITAGVVGRGVIGVLTDSETVYFGLGIATKYLVAAVLVGSVAIGAPLAAQAFVAVLHPPAATTSHRIFRTAMGQITVIGGLYYALSASFDIWLFRRSSVEGFVLVRFLANWPLSAAAIAAILAILQLQLRKIPGAPAFATMVEEQLGAAEASTTGKTSPTKRGTDA